MAWSWSHSPQAYEDARENLSELGKETLEIIFAEWRAAQGKGGIIHDHNHFNRRKYERALKHAKTLPDDVLADFIWEQASDSPLVTTVVSRLGCARMDVVAIACHSALLISLKVKDGTIGNWKMMNWKMNKTPA